MSYLDYYNLFEIENKDCSSCKIDKPKKTSSILPEILCTTKKNPVNLPDITACQNLCLNNDKCKAWSYQNDKGKCYLINETPLCNSNKNYTSGEILEYDIPNRKSYILNDIDLINKPTKKIQTKTAYLCKDTCINDNKCNKWSYNKDDNTCNINYGITEQGIHKKNMISGGIYVFK